MSIIFASATRQNWVDPSPDNVRANIQALYSAGLGLAFPSASALDQHVEHEAACRPGVGRLDHIYAP
jgi:hypothetical protein